MSLNYKGKCETEEDFRAAILAGAADPRDRLRLAPGSYWSGDWVCGDSMQTVRCLSTESLGLRKNAKLPDHTLDTGDLRWCWPADALAAIRDVGQDPEYIELLKARAEIERLKERVIGLTAELLVVKGLVR